MISMLLAAALLQAGPADQKGDRYARCADLVHTDPAAARADAVRWKTGGASAQACLGLAAAAQKDWAAAGTAFDEAARLADQAKDLRAANYRAQAGNAWLAAGKPDKARAALDTALETGTLKGLQLGEAQLDRARALVAADELDAARADLDHAVVNAADDPLAWLLSATLARRMGDVRRAKTDIGQALLRSSDDAQVQLEAGNIAAMTGDESGAREAWAQAARLQPNGAAGRSAVVALRQFDVPAATRANPTPVAAVPGSAAATPKPSVTR